MRALLVSIILLFNQSAWSRVFDFKEAMFAPYLDASYGSSKVGKDSFEGGFPTTSGVDGGISAMYSGEVGMAIQFGQLMSFRLGVELMNPFVSTQSTITDTNGNEHGTLKPEVFVIMPKATLEIYLAKKKASRWVFGIGGGYAYTTIRNTVTLNATGQAAYGLTEDYIEEGTSNDMEFHGHAGYEFNIVDNVGMALVAGYRVLTTSNITGNRPATTPIGTVSNGSPILNADGTQRSVSLTGPFFGISLRVYIR